MNIDPIAFSVFNLEIRWYGIITAVSLIIGFIVVYFIAKFRWIKAAWWLNLALFAVIVSILGARLRHGLVNWSYYSQNLGFIFAFRRGGLAIQRPMLAGIITLTIFTTIRKLDFWLWADIVIPGLLVGQAIGRWGNFFNQEAFGRPTDLPWGIYIDQANRPLNYVSYEYFHPTFLYESIANFLLFGLLIFMHWFYRKKPGKLPYGIILSMYLGIYAIYRTFIEYFRLDSAFLGPVKVVYIINLLTLVIAVIIANYVAKRFRVKKELEQMEEDEK